LKKWFSFFEPIIENQFNWSNSPDGTEILRAWAVAALAADYFVSSPSARVKRQLENGLSKKPKSVASENCNVY
jgi:hypothetical protein